MPLVTQKITIILWQLLLPFRIEKTLCRLRALARQLACSYFLSSAALLFQESFHYPCTTYALVASWGSSQVPTVLKHTVFLDSREIWNALMRFIASYSGPELWKTGVASLCIATETALQCTRAFKDIYHFLLSDYVTVLRKPTYFC